MAIVGRAKWEYPRIAGIFDRGTAVQLLIVVGFILRRRHIANRFEQSARVEPVDPRERREFDGLEMAPRSLALNHFGFEEADDRFGEGVVIRIAPTPDRRLDARLGEPVRVALDRYCVPRSL